MKIALILLAGGLSTRMNGKIPKTFLEIKKKPLIHYSLELFASTLFFSEKVIVCPDEYFSFFPKNTLFAKPGPRRQDSVKNGLLALQSDSDLVMIHDGARPLIKLNDLTTLIELGKNEPAAALADRVKNSLKKASSVSKVTETVSRDDLWEVYTPQLVEKKLLIEGFTYADKHNLTVTDDLSLVELLGYKPLLVPSSYPNIKLTYPSDIPLIEALL